MGGQVTPYGISDLNLVGQFAPAALFFQSFIFIDHITQPDNTDECNGNFVVHVKTSWSGDARDLFVIPEN